MGNRGHAQLSLPARRLDLRRHQRDPEEHPDQSRIGLVALTCIEIMQSQGFRHARPWCRASTEAGGPVPWWWKAGSCPAMRSKWLGARHCEWAIGHEVS